jgi:hypothetical protein
MWELLINQPLGLIEGLMKLGIEKKNGISVVFEIK